MSRELPVLCIFCLRHWALLTRNKKWSASRQLHQVSLNLHTVTKVCFCFNYLRLYYSENISHNVCFSGLKPKSRRKSSPHTKDRSGTNMKADPPLGESRDYILFSPTRLAIAMKKAKLQQSLQNQSASVLTVPSGLDISTLNDTVPQPGEVIFHLFLELFRLLPVSENAADTTENAGISISVNISLCINQIPCHVIY